MQATRFTSVLALVLVLTTGCASTGPTPARLYNLGNGDIVSAEMAYSGNGHGKMTAELPNGESCSGEYIIAGRGRSYGPGPYADPTRDPQELQNSERTTGEGMTWAEAYGYGEGTFVQPVGSATLVGQRGTVIEIVIYSYYYYHGVHGDGVGRDNHGNWYRIHIGKIPE